MTLTLTGSVKPGDNACDYILGDDVMYGLGEKRKTHLKLQKGKKVIIWPITLANITPAYGDANNINSLSICIDADLRVVNRCTSADSRFIYKSFNADC